MTKITVLNTLKDEDESYDLFKFLIPILLLSQKMLHCHLQFMEAFSTVGCVLKVLLLVNNTKITTSKTHFYGKWQCDTHNSYPLLRKKCSSQEKVKRFEPFTAIQWGPREKKNNYAF